MSFQLFFKSYGRYLGLICLVGSFATQAGPGFSCCNGDVAEQVQEQPSRISRYNAPVGVWYPKPLSRRHVRRKGVIAPGDTISIQVVSRGEQPIRSVEAGAIAINNSTVTAFNAIEVPQSTTDVVFSGAIFE